MQMPRTSFVAGHSRNLFITAGLELCCGIGLKSAPFALRVWQGRRERLALPAIIVAAARLPSEMRRHEGQELLTYRRGSRPPHATKQDESYSLRRLGTIPSA